MNDDNRLRADGAAFGLLALTVLLLTVGIGAAILLGAWLPALFGGGGIVLAFLLALEDRDRRWARWKKQDELERGVRTVLELEHYDPSSCESPH